MQSASRPREHLQVLNTWHDIHASLLFACWHSAANGAGTLHLMAVWSCALSGTAWANKYARIWQVSLLWRADQQSVACAHTLLSHRELAPLHIDGHTALQLRPKDLRGAFIQLWRVRSCTILPLVQELLVHTSALCVATIAACHACMQLAPNLPSRAHPRRHCTPVEALGSAHMHNGSDAYGAFAAHSERGAMPQTSARTFVSANCFSTSSSC